MDISKVVKGLNSADHRIMDSRRKKSLKRSVREKIMDTESTDEAIQVALDALQDEEPADVVQAVVEVLSETIDQLDDQVADSRKRKSIGLFDKKSFRKAIMDTETTEEAKDVAVEALSTAEPKEVIEAVVEVLSETIDDLQNDY